VEARARGAGGQPQPTAVLTHGANPGMVSHLVKQALVNIAGDLKLDAGKMQSREDWADLARRLDVRVIHIAERDTQVSSIPKEANEFVNTWSVDGFVSEGSQPAELGWGSNERNFPRDGKRHEGGSGAAIYVMQPGVATKVRSWAPNAGPYHGFLITHGESISIADYLTSQSDPAALYRPTVHYAYHPADNAVLSVHEFVGRNYVIQDRKRIMMDDITTGIDELGVLLAGHKKNAYWYGSQLGIDAARKLAPHNSATTLQVTVAVLSGMVWAMENPNRGIVEPDEMDYRRCLEICMPYLGPVVGQYTDWTPLSDRERLFPEDLDTSDPWQFKNVRVS
jgi:homospermidine synthase